MRIFCDFHHTELYHSLKLLFENRLGYQLYRPIGMEWQQQGYWKVFDHPATAIQYLGISHQATPLTLDGKVFGKYDVENWEYEVRDGIYYINEPSKDVVNRAITLDCFKELKFDILIASLPQHIIPFSRLIQLYQPQAKLIFQIGNSWNLPPGVRNVLSSTAPFPVPAGVNACFYHQEFDLSVFKYSPPVNQKIVNSYIHYMRELDLLEQYKSLMPDWTFTTYGAGMDSILYNQHDVANALHNSGWTWHVKPEGDGFGHSLHNSYACGRPAIIKKNYYAGKIANYLLEDMVTCLDISVRDPISNAQILNDLILSGGHQRMCENAYDRFNKFVDFDKEESLIRTFLGRLL